MRVVVADGSDFIRRMLRRAFMRAPGLELVGDSSCGQETLDLVASLHPDAVVTDLDLATLDGFELTRRLKSAYPEIHVVAHTSEGGAEPAMREAGASAFLMKGEAHRLIETLQRLD